MAAPASAALAVARAWVRLSGGYLPKVKRRRRLPRRYSTQKLLRPDGATRTENPGRSSSKVSVRCPPTERSFCTACAVSFVLGIYQVRRETGHGTSLEY